MHSAGPGKILSCALVITSALWTGIIGGQDSRPAGVIQQAGIEAHAQNGSVQEAESGPDVQTINVENLRALMIDLADYQACDFLRGRIFTLSSGGATVPASEGDVTGNFWIDSCSTGQVDPQHLRFTISGDGWRWISRQRERFGAEFEIDEYVKFSATVTMVGTLDLAYDPQQHIITAWFVPTRPVEADFQVLGDVEVETESLWSSIVGQGAEILGESPEKRALSEIRKKGTRRFRSKLSSGLTAIVNLCTGQRYTKFGTFPAGRIPEQPSEPREEPSLSYNRAVLHQNGILMSGPFDTGKPVIARVEHQEGGAVRATMVCEEDAQRLADAYTGSGTLPKVGALAEATAGPGNPASLEVPADTGCPVVLVMQPQNEQATPITYSFTVFHKGAGPEPLVKCE